MIDSAMLVSTPTQRVPAWAVWVAWAVPALPMPLVIFSARFLAVPGGAVVVRRCIAAPI
jgi:hypothetical protein